MKNNKGFVAIEILAVVSIITVLAVLGVPKYLGFVENTELKQIIHDVAITERVVGAEKSKKDDGNENRVMIEVWPTVGVEFLADAKKNGTLFDADGIVEEEQKMAEGIYRIVPLNYIKPLIWSELAGEFYIDNNGKGFYRSDIKGTTFQQPDRTMDIPIPPDIEYRPSVYDKIINPTWRDDKELTGWVVFPVTSYFDEVASGEGWNFVYKDGDNEKTFKIVISAKEYFYLIVKNGEGTDGQVHYPQVTLVTPANVVYQGLEWQEYLGFYVDSQGYYEYASGYDSFFKNGVKFFIVSEYK